MSDLERLVEIEQVLAALRRLLFRRPDLTFRQLVLGLGLDYSTNASSEDAATIATINTYLARLDKTHPHTPRRAPHHEDHDHDEPDQQAGCPPPVG